MKILFYFGHPAQFSFNRLIIRHLKDHGHEVYIYIKSKDVLSDLLKATGWKYNNVLPEKRGKSRLSIAWSLIRRDIILAKEVLKHKPDLLISSDPSVSQVSWLFNKPCLNFLDDDVDAVGLYGRLTLPFTTLIITPSTVRVGRWEHKRIKFEGYLKLAYLHPHWFRPDPAKIGVLRNTPYYLIRLSDLAAHHDAGMKGIDREFLRQIILLLSEKGQVKISSESMLPEEFNSYKLSIPVDNMHHYLYYAQALISDSQSMSGEAAALGTPSIRINSFVGKLSVLEELEHRYQLTFGFKPGNRDAVLHKITELLSVSDLKEEFQKRRQKMLSDKIDVTAFAIWLIENYPGSVKIMKKTPEYQNNFR
jgi:uncharacterized protein